MVGDKVDDSGRGLAELLVGLKAQVSGNAAGVQITAITADSREAGPGALFVAVPGLRVDGHQFAEEVAAKGCTAMVIERGRRLSGKGLERVVLIEVEDTRLALGELAAAFYGYPARRLKMIAITGTNGKTTTAYLLEAVLLAAGARPGVIGTVNYRYAGKAIPAPFTTPEPVQLQKLLAEMATERVTHVVMEVSSHALAQKRLQGVCFDVALFTNLSRDHLDFHGDMERYFKAKKVLFEQHLNPEATAVILRDGAGGDVAAKETGDWGCRLVRELTAVKGPDNAKRKIVTCGMRAGNDLYPLSATSSLAGITAKIALADNVVQIKTSLVGEYNLKNVLGCLGVGTALGLEVEKMVDGLGEFAGVPGRLERVRGADARRPAVFVDYAHTPDALENVLSTLRVLTPARLIVVFGCGGDRDRGKRALMGEVAGRLADVVLVTSDNPRSESPEAILDQVEAGLAGMPRMRGEALLRRHHLRGYDIIPSRRQAIRIGVQGAAVGDVVLVSGKGHECYQLDRNGKRFFDDRIEARKSLAVVA